MRGSMLDVLLFPILVAAFIAIAMLVGRTTQSIHAGFKTQLAANAEATEAMTNAEASFSAVDRTFPLILLGLILAMWISAALVGIHPIFIPINLLLLGLEVIFAWIGSKILVKLTEDATLVAIVPTTSFFWNNLMLISVFAGLISIVIMMVSYNVAGKS